MTRKTSFKSVLTLSASMAACAAMVAGLSLTSPALADTGYRVKCDDDRANTGRVIGAVLGGVAANQLTKQKDKETGKKKSNTLATIAGAVAGGYAGGKVSCALNAKDRQMIEEYTSQTLETGTETTWYNRDSGLNGRAWVSGNTSQPVSYTLPVVAERVSALPSLDLINGQYRTTSTLNVRSGPGTNYPVVDKLTRGETVSVMARVSGQNWYLLEQNGIGIGYVSASSLQAISAVTLPARPPVNGTVENRTITVQQPCRVVTQSIDIKGKVTTEQVTACYTAEGWKVV